MSERLLASTAALWLALLALSLALSTLASIHDKLPGDTGTASWLQGLSFPGESLAGTVRSITSTQLLLAAGGALALLLWLRGYQLEALVFAAALIVLLLLRPASRRSWTGHVQPRTWWSYAPASAAPASPPGT